MLPKAEGGASVAELDRRLDRHGRHGNAHPCPSPRRRQPRSSRLGPSIARTPRLCGLTWGAEDLPAAIGAAGAREADGRYTAPYEMVRALALFAAHAADVPAIETIFPMLKDEAGLKTYAARGRRDGFSGMLAIHPAQVPPIHAAFTPSKDEIAWARRVVEAFAASPDSGVHRDGRPDARCAPSETGPPDSCRGGRRCRTCQIRILEWTSGPAAPTHIM